MSTTLRLPTAAAFVALPINKRAILFGRWLKKQPRKKGYDYADLHGCALAQFSQAIFRDKRARGIVSQIAGSGWNNETIRVFPSGGSGALANAVCYNRVTVPPVREQIDLSLTFGAASDAYQLGLKKARIRA